MQKGQMPAVSRFSALADYLGVSTDYLLGKTAWFMKYRILYCAT